MPFADGLQMRIALAVVIGDFDRDERLLVFHQ